MLTATTDTSSEFDNTDLYAWVAAALSTLEEAKFRKWSFKRLIKSGPYRETEQQLEDALWLAAHYSNWKDLFIPTTCPIEARRILEPILSGLRR